MNSSRRFLILSAVAAASLVASLPSHAGSQLITFTYGTKVKPGPVLLGPGGARSIRAVVIPASPGPATVIAGEDIKATLVTNAPGCADPKLDIKGKEFSCDWATPCLDFGESVAMCFTSGTPLTVVSAFVADEFGDSLGPANASLGPFLSGPGCVASLDCSGAVATVPAVWPPNHKLYPVTITGIASPSGNRVRVKALRVTQDEPLVGRGDGNTCPDGVIVDGVAKIRAERTGAGNGRVYAISFVANDGVTECQGVVNVCVPRDQAHLSCVDDGQRYSSAGPCRNGCDSRSETDGAPSTQLAIAATGIQGSAADIQYSIPARGDVTLGVYDVAGRRIATLVNEPQEAGTHEVSWNTGGLASGVYFYRLRVGQQVATRVLRVAR